MVDPENRNLLVLARALAAPARGESALPIEDKNVVFAYRSHHPSLHSPRYDAGEALSPTRKGRRSRSSSSSPHRAPRPTEGSTPDRQPSGNNANGKQLDEYALRTEIQDEKAAVEVLKHQKEKLTSKVKRLQGAISCARWESEDAEEAAEEQIRHLQFWEDQVRRSVEHDKLQREEVMEVHSRAAFLETHLPNLEQEVAKVEFEAQSMEQQREHVCEVSMNSEQDARIGVAVSATEKLQEEVKQLEVKQEKIRKKLITEEVLSTARLQSGSTLRKVNPELLEALKNVEGLRAETQKKEELLLDEHRQSEGIIMEQTKAEVQESDMELIESRANHAGNCHHAKILANSVAESHEEQRSLKEKISHTLGELKEARERHDVVFQDHRNQGNELKAMRLRTDNAESHSQLCQEETREAKCKMVNLFYDNERIRAIMAAGKSSHGDRLQQHQAEVDELKSEGVELEAEARREGLRRRDCIQNELRTAEVEVMELRCEQSQVRKDYDILQRQCRLYQHESDTEQRAAAVAMSDIGRTNAELSQERLHSRNGSEAVEEMRDALLRSQGQASILRSSVAEFQQFLAEAREAATTAAAASAASRLQEEEEARKKKSKSKDRGDTNPELFEKALQALIAQQVSTLRQYDQNDREEPRRSSSARARPGTRKNVRH